MDLVDLQTCKSSRKFGATCLWFQSCSEHPLLRKYGIAVKPEWTKIKQKDCETMWLRESSATQTFSIALLFINYSTTTGTIPNLMSSVVPISGALLGPPHGSSLGMALRRVTHSEVLCKQRRLQIASVFTVWQKPHIPMPTYCV